MRKFLFTLITLILFSVTAYGYDVRIKDITELGHGSETSLIGYGLIIGLDGTGDRTSGTRGAVFTIQSISNMLEQFGISVPTENLNTRNVASVMITASLPGFARIGTQFDVTVASIGDAKSLEGGILLMTPLRTGEGEYVATAQGPLSVGGFSIDTAGGESIKKNYSLTGRVPNGGKVNFLSESKEFDTNEPLRFRLRYADATTANNIANSINNHLQSAFARPVNPSMVEVDFPDTVTTFWSSTAFIARVETLKVATDMKARVVINERTGTVIAGGRVTVEDVMISHGSITIHTSQTPVISQPAGFSSGGQTAVVPTTKTDIEETATIGVITGATTVNDLASALSELGVNPRDIIIIFQAIKGAGALNADLVIM